jgi:integrase
LDRNPFKGFPLPREESPRRPALTQEQYEAMLTVAPDISPLFRLALVLANETGHRISSIRLLRWSDVNLKDELIRWRAEHDKIGMEHETLLTPAAVQALKDAQAEQATIGATWVFPKLDKPTEPQVSAQRGDAVTSEPCSRHQFNDWWQLAAARTGLPTGKRIGWHSLRRKFATEMKDIPIADLCTLGGWREPTTIVRCYQQPDRATQRRALAQRRTLRATGVA